MTPMDPCSGYLVPSTNCVTAIVTVRDERAPATRDRGQVAAMALSFAPNGLLGKSPTLTVAEDSSLISEDARLETLPSFQPNGLLSTTATSTVAPSSRSDSPVPAFEGSSLPSPQSAFAPNGLLSPNLVEDLSQASIDVKYDNESLEDGE